MDQAREKQLVKVAMLAGLSAKEAKSRVENDEAFRRLCEMYLEMQDKYLILRFNEKGF